MATVNTWSLPQETALIDFWEDREYLWNPKHHHYFRRDLRNSAIQAIIAGLDKDVNGVPFTAESVKKKVKHLRDNLLREIKKIEGSKKLGLSPESVYSSNWIHFNRLQYLRRTFKADPSFDNIPEFPQQASVSSPVESVEYFTNDSLGNETDFADVKVEIDEEMTPSPKPQVSVAKKVKRVKRMDTPSPKDQIFCKALQMMNEEKSTKYSSEEIFGMFIASVLKTFSKEKQAQIKFQIHKLLFDFERNDADSS